jgi:hypothetical protein
LQPFEEVRNVSKPLRRERNPEMGPNYERSSSSVERRNATGYKIGIPVTFLWKGGGKKRGQVRCTGMVRDVSLDGVFILSSTCPGIGSEVQMEIEQADHLRRLNSLIKARMKVLRIEHNPGAPHKVGFAAYGKILDGPPRRREERIGVRQSGSFCRQKPPQSAKSESEQREEFGSEVDLRVEKRVRPLAAP